MFDSQFPPGTPVRVRQSIVLRGRNSEAEAVGVIDAWEELPTGSWYAHGKDHKLWLQRLKLRKVDGEITLLIVDNNTSIAALEPRTLEAK